MSRKKKTRILWIFTIGFLACISSVVRLVYSVQLSQVSDTNAASQAQQLATDKDGLWGFAEIALGIIAGCMPVIPRFFKQPFFTRMYNGSWLGWTSSATSSSGNTLVGGPWIFGKRNSRKTPPTSAKNSQSSESSTTETNSSIGGAMKSFKGIETQNLTRASLDLDMDCTFKIPIKPEPAVHRMGSRSPLVNDPHMLASSMKVSPARPVDREQEWQEMSRIEQAAPWQETLRDSLER